MRSSNSLKTSPAKSRILSSLPLTSTHSVRALKCSRQVLPGNRVVPLEECADLHPIGEIDYSIAGMRRGHCEKVRHFVRRGVRPADRGSSFASYRRLSRASDFGDHYL